MLASIIGWVALVVIFPAGWFQVVKNYRRKSTEGVSVLMFSSLFTGIFLFLIVSLLEPTPLPTIVQFGAGVLVNGIVLLQVFIYRKKKLTD